MLICVVLLNQVRHLRSQNWSDVHCILPSWTLHKRQSIHLYNVKGFAMHYSVISNHSSQESLWSVAQSHIKVILAFKMAVQRPWRRAGHVSKNIGVWFKVEMGSWLGNVLVMWSTILPGSSPCHQFECWEDSSDKIDWLLRYSRQTLSQFCVWTPCLTTYMYIEKLGQIISDDRMLFAALQFLIDLLCSH